MNKRVIYTRPDGGLSVVIPSDAVRDDDIPSLIRKVVPPDASGVRVVDELEMPSDRTFRDEWEDDGMLVKVNMPKSRVTHLNRLREKRKPILAMLDVEWSRAMAQKNQTLADQIEAKRQALRDMPQTVRAELDQAKTPDELKAIEPLILKG